MAKGNRMLAARVRAHTVLCPFWSSMAGIGLLLAGVSAHAAIPTSERQVLLNIYAYTDGSGWDSQYQAGWNGPPGTECNWYGITCDATGSTVTGINLAGVGMFGTLPSLATLTNLETFNIQQTATSGIGAINSLYGPIPPLAGLTHLRMFLASNTYFNGGVPSLAGLSNLTDFEVVNCGLDGTIPSLAGLTQLVRFDVHNNQLGGGIPALSGLSNLAYFDV
ncbi:MAG: hypothetical protein ACYC9P_06900, partial [Rudaea sp.]